MLTVYGTFSRPGEARVPERGKEGQGGSPWCRVTAAGSSRVAASQNSVFKNCVLVPTSRLMTLFFFFPAGQQRFLRFFTAFASLAPRGSANVC